MSDDSPYRGFTKKELVKMQDTAKAEYAGNLKGGFLGLASKQLSIVNSIHDEIKRRKETKIAEDYDEWGNYIGPENSKSVCRRVVKWLAS